MEQIHSFRIFGFLAFIGSAFLSAIFHYPVFTVCWFVVMIMFMISNTDEPSKSTILAFSALAYTPLGLIGIFMSDLSKKSTEYQFWMLTVFIIIELILAISWLTRQN